MKKINDKIRILKNNKSCYKEYIKCFTNNEKAKELFVRSDSFKSLRDYISTKKVS